jgi:hypothetical protein
MMTELRRCLEKAEHGRCAAWASIACTISASSLALLTDAKFSPANVSTRPSQMVLEGGKILSRELIR